MPRITAIYETDFRSTILNLLSLACKGRFTVRPSSYSWTRHALDFEKDSHFDMPFPTCGARRHSIWWRYKLCLYKKNPGSFGTVTRVSPTIFIIMPICGLSPELYSSENPGKVSKVGEKSSWKGTDCHQSVGNRWTACIGVLQSGDSLDFNDESSHDTLDTVWIFESRITCWICAIIWKVKVGIYF